MFEILNPLEFLHKLPRAINRKYSRMVNCKEHYTFIWQDKMTDKPGAILIVRKNRTVYTWMICSNPSLRGVEKFDTETPDVFVDYVTKL